MLQNVLSLYRKFSAPCLPIQIVQKDHSAIRRPGHTPMTGDCLNVPESLSVGFKDCMQLVNSWNSGNKNLLTSVPIYSSFTRVGIIKVHGDLSNLIKFNRS
jgi:hypothetical protein